MPAALARLKDKKVIVGATAIELGDRFSVPNGRVVPGPQLQMLAAESILQGRVLRSVSGVTTLGGLGFIMLLMVVLWRRLAASVASADSGRHSRPRRRRPPCCCRRNSPSCSTPSLWHLAVAAYLAAMALDEIDFRGLLGGIAEKRFQQIAMSLGDGLVCADERGLITVWNPGAVAIFGYEPKEMIGQPFERICAVSGADEKSSPFSILELPLGLQGPGGTVMEFEGRRKDGQTFPLEACFSKWQGIEGFQYGAVMRDISDRKREAERIKYLAEHDTLTGLANRNTLYEHLGSMLAEANQKQGSVALLMLDLDKFKQVNDTLGHACGDQLLCGSASG